MIAKRLGWLALWATCGSLAAIGCQQQEQIEFYTVAKPPPIERPASPQGAQPAAVPTGEPTDRTLAAIVPRPGQGWFFKLTGAKDAVSSQLEPFQAFLKSVRFNPEGKPQWTLPDGWQERPGSDIRYATLVLPGQEKLEVSVTALPNPGDDEPGYVLANVNRWRGQLRLPPLALDQLEAESTRLEFDGGTATLVNLLGHAAPGGMGRPPFVSGARDGN